MFNSDNFISTEILISFKNESTKTAPRLKNQTHSNDTTLNEITEKGMILELPKTACSTGHHLFITLEIKKGKKNIKFESTVKVLKSELLEDSMQRIHTELVQYSENTWEELNQFFAQEQNSALDLFKSIRGY